MRAAALSVAAVAVTSALAPAAHADDRPLLVVVESAPQEAAAIRHGIAEATGAPVVALGDEGAERSSATLSVALSGDRRSAWVCYRNGDRPRYEQLSAPADAGRGLGWVATAAADLVRRAESDRRDWSIADEVLDPFAGETRHTQIVNMRLPAEIIDPWERPGVATDHGTESPEQLSPPSPRR